MADFCKKCSIKMFGQDFGDIRASKEGEFAVAICEGHGKYVVVDHEGEIVDEREIG